MINTSVVVAIKCDIKDCEAHRVASSDSRDQAIFSGRKDGWLIGEDLTLSPAIAFSGGAIKPSRIDMCPNHALEFFDSLKAEIGPEQ